MNVFRSIRKHVKAAESPADGQEQENTGPHATGVAREFLPSYQELIENPPSGFGRIFALSVILVCVIAIVWSIIGRVDVVSTAPGRLIVGGLAKVVQAPTAGTVTAIDVKNGDSVSTGQVLIEMDPTAADAEFDRLNQQLSFSVFETARLEALLNSEPGTDFDLPQDAEEQRLDAELAYLDIQWQEHKTQVAFIEAQIEKNLREQKAAEEKVKEIDQVLQNMQERYDIRKGLEERGLYSRLNLLEQEQAILQQKTSQREQVSQISVLQAEESTLNKQIEQERAQWRGQVRDKLEEALKNSASLRQEIIKAQQAARERRIVSPIDGVVQQVAVNTIGGVLKEGEQLMVIVPDEGKLEARVTVLDDDVGFVHQGQPAELKVAAYPYTRYGTVKGKVSYVSRDSERDQKLGLVYPALIELDSVGFSQGDQQLVLDPGMGVTAEIKTDQRRVIDYLLSPLIAVETDALRER